MIKSSAYEEALSKTKNDIRKMNSPKGFESVIQKHLVDAIGTFAKTEVSLKRIGACQACGSENGRLDIRLGDYGIELKVVRIPRFGAVASNALYDIGQLSSDYWRIKNAQKLRGGELCILLYGCLIAELSNPTAILREFHNRMFIDFSTSMHFGELLKEQKTSDQRQKQIDAIKEMGFHAPYNEKMGKKIVVDEEFALIVIPVKGANKEDTPDQKSVR